MFTFNFYSLPLDYKKSDRVIDVAPLLTRYAASKLTRTSQDGVSYKMNDGTTISLAYKGESTAKKNYLEIDCSSLPTEQKILGIDKTYWFMVSVQSVNSPSNFTSLWTLDVFATYGAQVFNDMNGKDVKVIRKHSNRYKKLENGSLIANFDEENDSMFTSEFNIDKTQCNKNISSFSNTKMKAKLTGSGTAPLEGNFLLTPQYITKIQDINDNSEYTGTVLPYGATEYIRDLLKTNTTGKQFVFDWYSGYVRPPVRDRWYISIYGILDGKAWMFGIYSNGRPANEAQRNVFFGNTGKTYKITATIESGWYEGQTSVSIVINSAVAYAEVPQTTDLTFWNNYAVNAAGGVQYALASLEPYTKSNGLGSNTDIQLGGVMLPIFSRVNASFNNIMEKFRDANTKSIRNSAFVYQTRLDTDLVDSGLIAKPLLTVSKDKSAVIKSLPVKKTLNFNPMFSFGQDKSVYTQELTSYGYEGTPEDWYTNNGGTNYNPDTLDYYDDNTIEINTYFENTLNSTDYLLTFNHKNEPKLLLDIVKMTYLYAAEGLESDISLTKLFVNQSGNAKYLWQQEYTGPASALVKTLFTPYKNTLTFANMFIGGDTSLTPTTQDAWANYILENSSKYEAAKTQISLTEKQGDRNTQMQAANAAVAGISAVMSGNPLAGIYAAQQGLSAWNNSITNRENAQMQREQLQAEINDIKRKSPSHNAGNIAVLNNYASVSQNCPFEIATYLPEEHAIKDMALYLHKFGYSLNRTQSFTEDLYKSRTDFNYIQLQDIAVLNQTGNYHKEIVDLIQFELGNGVRIWHTTNIGDFTVGNIERSLI